jgi:hypothetical protein
LPAEAQLSKVSTRSVGVEIAERADFEVAFPDVGPLFLARFSG